MATTSNGRTTYEQWIFSDPWRCECQECGRRFDLTKQDDAEEYEYGHDCE